MAGSSVSELVIFIAAVSVAAGVSGAMVTTVGGISDSLDERGADVAATIDTDVELISDPGSDALYAGGDLRLLVKNTGGRTLAAERVELLVDGRYVASPTYTTTVVGADSWGEGDVLRIRANRTLEAGDHRATVVVRSERETIRFRT